MTMPVQQRLMLRSCSKDMSDQVIKFFPHTLCNRCRFMILLKQDVHFQELYFMERSCSVKLVIAEDF